MSCTRPHARVNPSVRVGFGDRVRPVGMKPLMVGPVAGLLPGAEKNNYHVDAHNYICQY